MPPPRKPKDLKLVSGTYRADREAVANSAQVGPIGPPPAHFTEALAGLWREIASSAPWLRAPDRSVLAGFVPLLDARDRAVLLYLSAGGALQVRASDGRHRRQVANPLLRLVVRLNAELNASADKLGLTPRSRSALNLEAAPVQDGLLAKYMTPARGGR